MLFNSVHLGSLFIAETFAYLPFPLSCTVHNPTTRVNFMVVFDTLRNQK